MWEKKIPLTEKRFHYNGLLNRQCKPPKLYQQINKLIHRKTKSKILDFIRKIRDIFGSTTYSVELVWSKCVRCPWALQRKRSVHYFWDYLSSFFSFLGHTFLTPKGVVLGCEILHGSLTHQKIRFMVKNNLGVKRAQNWERGPPSAPVELYLIV